jgi:hypothetical protein
MYGTYNVTLWRIHIKLYILGYSKTLYNFTRREHFCGDLISLTTADCA